MSEALCKDVTASWRCDGMSYESVYRSHSGAVHAVAVQICGAPMADDVTQDVFLRLWRQPESFDPARGTLRTLLVVMVRHAAVDHLRAQGARRARERRVEDAARDIPVGVDDQLLRAELQAVVRAALAELRSEDRLAISVAFFGGCTYREAAVVLGIPEGTVKTRIRRGMHRLRASLELKDLVTASGRELDLQHVGEQLLVALDARAATEAAIGIVAEVAAARR